MSVDPPTLLRHDALLYDGDREFAASIVPFLRDGLDLGQKVVAVATPDKGALLRDALGSEASQVSFIEIKAFYGHPARTIAEGRRTIDAALADGYEGVRVTGEIPFDDRVSQQQEWCRFEAAINRAFASTPVWIVCPYDVRALPPSILRHAGRTHPHVIRANQRSPSSAYVEPDDFIMQYTAPEPNPPGALLAELRVNGELAPARRALRMLAERNGMKGENIEHLTSAVNEVLTNALVHGAPPVGLRVYSDGTTLMCEVADAGGRLNDPLAGYTPPAVAEEPESGMGLWLARQICDHVELAASDDQTIVRLSKRVG